MIDWLFERETQPRPEFVCKKTISQAHIYTLDFTLAGWKKEHLIDSDSWKNRIKIILPHKVSHKSALVYLNGSTLESHQACEVLPSSLDWALESQSVVVEVSLIPSQSFCFKDEIDRRYQELGRKEDALVAYTWWQFLKTLDPTWPLQIPMTKSVILALDIIQDFLMQKIGLSIEHFALSGKSKRGWVAWLVAAFDSRVKCVIPIVIDVLNLKESLAHHYRTYEGWAPGMRDYQSLNIDQESKTEAFSKLLKLVEPYHHLEHLKMPKYIVNAAGDEFFLPDSSQFYFSQLKGPKYLRYVPNCGHYIQQDLTVFASIGAFYLQWAQNRSLPAFSWGLEGSQSLWVRLDDIPGKAVLWSAYNPKKRDFRLCEVGSIWKSKVLDIESAMLKVDLKSPDQGFRAYFVELHYPNQEGGSLIFTTEVTVVGS